MLRHRYDIVAVHHRRSLETVDQNTRILDPLAPDQPLAENAHPVFAVRADLTDQRDVDRVVEIALARHDRIDLLVHAAADVRFLGDILNYSKWSQGMREQFDVNVDAALRVASTVARRFWRDRDLENRSRNRSLINVSSTSGLAVFGRVGQSSYSASKAALNYFTCHMAAEFASFGIRANAVAPTSFPRRIPTRRVVEAIDDLTNSDATGKVLLVDERGARFTR
jgi:NAD(P)-dependent dehydrogenase (short-subunit alcohol dehydrogenase family)